MYNNEYAAGLPALREALTDFGAGMSAEDELHWSWFATTTAIRLWDEEQLDAFSARHLRLARELGSLSELPLALTTRAYTLLFRGEINAAAVLTDEIQAVTEATGTALAPYGALGVAAFRGDTSVAYRLLDTTLADVARRGEGVGITFAEWSHAVLANGFCQYEEALSAARRAAEYQLDPVAPIWASVELIEAAVRTGEGAVATGTYGRLAAMTSASGTDWALGLQARSQALLSGGSEAEELYRESIVRLGRTRLRVDLARARLLYGEWLRRERRQGDAREQLRTAQTMFGAMGVDGFAERANRELRAAGGSAHKRVDANRDDELTAQEAKIARLAREGLSNPEIAHRLLISPHTVQYHLRKVFTKLGITSRTQL
jgi:DNA-binding CsgD family transcriptional regulator